MVYYPHIIWQQQAYCERHKVPFFMPLDGKCFNCQHDITRYITQQQAIETHIVSCPHCNWSYCD